MTSSALPTRPAPPPEGATRLGADGRPDATPRAGRRRDALVREWLPLTALYTLLGVFLTWPMPARMQSGMFGFGNDNFGGMLFVEYIHRAFWGPESRTFTPELQVPFGLEIDERFISPYDRLFSIVFGGIQDGLFAYNLEILVSFPLAGLTMYALARYLTGNRPASALAGVIFAASPFHLAMSMQYAAMASIQWAPLAVLATIHALRTRTIRSAVLLGLALSLVWATSYYFGWFSIWFVAAIVVTAGAVGLAKAVRRGDVAATVKEGARFVVTRGAVMAGVMVVILVPLLFTLISGVASDGAAYARSSFDLQINSVRPWQYVLPPHDNPIFDSLTANVIQTHTGVLPVYEQSVYLGIVPSLLALAGVVLVARGRGRAAARFVVLPFLVAAAFMVVLSLGPRIPYEVTSIGDWLSPTTNPSFPGPVNLLFEVSANFRYYGRTFVFTSVALAALAAIGFALLTRGRLGRNRTAVWGLSALAMVLVVAEFSPRPPNRFVDLRAPAWVEAVQELPADASIVNYPVADYSSPRSLFYTYWQTRHDHATVNPPESPRAQAFQRSIDDPDSFLAGRELARAGVDYAVVHTDLPAPTFPPYQPALPDDSLPRDAGRDNPYLREVRRTPDAVIYEVRDRPTRVEGAVVGFAAGWGEVEADPGGRWRWARNPEAVMNVFAARTYERATLSFGVTSFNRARRMDVLFDGRRVLRTTVPPDRVAELEIPLGRMTRGPHRLELVVTPGVERVDDVLKNGDLRFISVRVRTPRISVPRDGR